ncbi:uncharacterized protein LOC115693166 isoform X1 [Syzygium oleosum]|uniref:uncharacterized protein LOC115693166 isoform X1 n=1 Tax=Syzygium oleosum TaxID=219896 RepID=UPI0011D1C0A9|nr:uncharacterized protein LOC115693166 isoform X1 [Syzygium oleosum]XP_056162144.1 uncharacterized protein LOC115693166 isoform X1 [Syzygium oleosum]
MTTRFKKGSKVEVWSTKEMPVGSWQCAEVAGGNGHTYTVQYCSYGSASCETTMERVSGKAIRPCPPALQALQMWTPGDIVEVFENFSWKMAMVLKVLGRSNFLVRFLGSPREFGVGNAHIRVRQSWKDNRWIVIGQISAIADDRRGDLCQDLTHDQSPGNTIQIANVRKKASIRDGCIPIKKRPVFEESHDTLKTESPYECSRVESPARASKKRRAIDKKGRCFPVSATRSTPAERVGSAAFQRETCGANTACVYSKKEAAILSKVDECGMKPSGDVGRPYPSQSRSDADGETCSVGSCTVASESSSNFSADPFDDVNSYANETESISWQNKEQVLEAEIHRLELHAYRCTLEAFYASGPLSWEQEALISNLRLSLHISDDEHLLELRNLVFSDNIIPLGRQ